MEPADIVSPLGRLTFSTGPLGRDAFTTLLILGPCRHATGGLCPVAAGGVRYVREMDSNRSRHRHDRDGRVHCFILLAHSVA